MDVNFVVAVSDRETWLVPTQSLERAPDPTRPVEELWRARIHGPVVGMERDFFWLEAATK